MVVIWDVLITWAVQKVLDYMLHKAVKMGRKHLAGITVDDLSEYLLLFYAKMTILPTVKRLEENRDALETWNLTVTLRMHRSIHLLMSSDRTNRLCPICKILREKQAVLHKYVKDENLYPPFNQ